MTRRKPKEQPPPAESLVLSTLRKARGWTGQELAQASGTSTQVISLYETGDRPPSRERLEALAAAMGYRAEDVDFLLLALKSAGAGEAAPRAPVDPTPEELRGIRRTATRVGVAAVDLTEQALVKLIRARRLRKARQDAARLWERLRSETPAKRRLLVEKAREFQTWGLAERLCHESEDAASDRADRALELAGLAQRVAELAPGEEAWRSRLQGYALAFLANAQRVANDLPRAEATFAHAWKLWEAGADFGVLAAWRLLDLEASLHRGRRQFPEALTRLDQARAVAPSEAAGRILLKRAATLDQMGEAEQAIETLQEATPLVEGKCQPRLLFGLRFNLAAGLCRLARYAEAEPLLVEVRDLAVEMRKELDLVRVVWLEGKINSGLGRTHEAIVSFEQVRREFSTREMAYDAALATLELAELYLLDGRTQEVRGLASEMAWIFRCQRVHREAIAALTLFCEAARNEAATAEMARKVGQYLVRAQSNPDLRFTI